MEPRGGVGIENLGCGTGGKAECLFKRGTLGWICGTDILVLVLFVWLNLGSGSIDLSQRSKGGERWWVMRIWFAEWGKRWSIGSNVGHWVGYAGADTDALDKVG